ncbi:MAG: prolipoprotein diacylglyceryl transferase [Bacteroidia bacterium]|nr:prolipoprotein diacylglyceryl transferase [Bacteroidia bacterium]NNJ54906.1 prolipoprotein diacylglyceryl transferase [Bacteroidia bacterium]
MFPKIVSIPIPEFLQGFLPAQITVYSYGLMIALGILAAFYVALKKSRKLGINVDVLSSLFMWVILASFVGGKLFYFLEDIQKYLDDPSLIKRAMQGGFVFYGSLIFAIPTIIWWLRKEKIKVRPFLDILAFAGPVVHSIGRIGCFLAGCCHGKVCDSPLGVTFTHPDSLANPLNTPLYPTQLFDIAVNLIILVTVYYIEKKQKFEGQLFLIYLMMYGVGRSIVEMFRGDEARGFVFGGLLSHSQFIAVLIIATCCFFWWKWRKKTA